MRVLRGSLDVTLQKPLSEVLPDWRQLSGEEILAHATAWESWEFDPETPDEYTQEDEWGGYTVSKAQAGFVIESWSARQGELTERKLLLPYGRAAGGYSEDAKLASPHNEGVTVGQYLAEYACIDNPHARVINKGRIVR